jgi:hypothetical protein
MILPSIKGRQERPRKGEKYFELSCQFGLSQPKKIKEKRSHSHCQIESHFSFFPCLKE